MLRTFTLRRSLIQRGSLLRPLSSTIPPDTVSKLQVPSEYEFDLVVIGSGPSGQKGAINAAKMGKRVAVVDKATMIGGVCVHTGTIPSKTFREAVLHLIGYRQKAF